MVLLPVASLKPGMIVAKNVYDNNVKSFGLSLIMRGTVLGEPIIKRLQSHGIMSVYIERNGTEDISPDEILTNDMKNAAISSIRAHHERFDGNGYPGSLGSEKIHPFGKIIAVADVYDAITSNRPYRKPAQPFEAVEYIMGCGNSHFDIQTVNHFLKKIVAFPEGSVVKLSDGSKGIVVSNNPENVMRPKLRLLKPDGAMRDVNMINDPSCLNLTILGMDDIA